MARRRRKHPEHENLERWLISYADFITLLFAFFVVMYAISSVNEGKYRVLSDTLVEAFDNGGRNAPIEVGSATSADLLADKGGVDAGLVNLDAALTHPEPAAPLRTSDAARQPAADANPAYDLLPGIEEKLRKALGGFIDRDLVEVDNHGDWVSVDMKSKMLFRTGSAVLSLDALAVLAKIARILAPDSHEIQVEGHTDNVPIRTRQYPSNWELSAARAASVVHFLAGKGVEPRRMAAVGYGEYRPIADNATLEGRQKNRRVSLIILGHGVDPSALQQR